MKILHVATRHRLGGAERNLAHFVTRQQALGHEVHVALGCDGEPKDLGCATVHRLPELERDVAPGRDLQALRSIRSLITEQAFDVVHTHQSKAGAVGRLAAVGTGAVIVHTVHMPSFGPGYGRVQSAVYLSVERVCGRLTDRFIAVGNEVNALYVERRIAARDRIATIHSPIDVDVFLRTRGDQGLRRAARARLLAGSENPPLVGAVCALDPRKRVDLILESLAPGLRLGEFHLVVAGSGPEREALEELARTLGISDRVLWLGHCSQIAEVFAAIDVLVHASRVEGVPQVVIQALAAGKPIVATDVEGLREVNADGIFVVDRAGNRLLAAVRDALAARTDLVTAEALMPWRPAHVESAIDSWIADLQTLVAARTRSKGTLSERTA